MAKIREDLAGVVSVDGYNLSAGDTVPDDVTVGGHVLEAEKPAEDKPKRQTRSKAESEDK